MSLERCPHPSIGLGCPARRPTIESNAVVALCDPSVFIKTSRYQNSPPLGCTKDMGKISSPTSPYDELARMLRR